MSRTVGSPSADWQEGEARTGFESWDVLPPSVGDDEESGEEFCPKKKGLRVLSPKYRGEGFLSVFILYPGLREEK